MRIYVDIAGLDEALRARLNADHPDRPRLTLMPFLVLALVRAVPDFPQMNALYDDEAETIERHAAVHVGIATQTPSGLMVPVLRHAEALGFAHVWVSDHIVRPRTQDYPSPHLYDPLLALLPPVTNTDPPSDDDNVRPACTTTTPPTPLSPVPTTTLREPPRPLVASPLITLMYPELPEYDVPLLNNTQPDTPTDRRHHPDRSSQELGGYVGVGTATEGRRATPGGLPREL